MATLQQFIDRIKRKVQNGTVGLNTDQPAADILANLNDAAVAMWEMNDWRWGIVYPTLSVPAATITPLAIDSTVGRVISMGFAGLPGSLKIYTDVEWRNWQKLQDTPVNPSDPASGFIPQTAQITGAVERGLDASGNLQFLFVPPPTQITVIEITGKKRLSTPLGSIPTGIEYQVADIPNIAIPNYGYFPPEVMNILMDFAEGRYLRDIKDVRGQPILDAVATRITRLQGTQRTQPVEAATTHPPDYIRFVNRKRGGRTCA